jgi:hypothetical protein
MAGLAVALIVAVASTSVHGAVFCARKSGVIVIRTGACTRREQPVDPPVICGCGGSSTTTTTTTTLPAASRCCGGIVFAGCADVPVDSTGVEMCQALQTLAGDGRFNYLSPPGNVCDGNGSCAQTRTVLPDCCQIDSPRQLCFQGFSPAGSSCTGLGGTAHLNTACLASGACAGP